MISTLLLLDSDWYDLLTEDAAFSRRLTSLVTLYSVLILVLARDLLVLRARLCTDALHRSTHRMVYNSLLQVISAKVHS